MNEIKWGERIPADEAGQGHSPVRFGFSQSYRVGGYGRSYVRCECGTRLSGRGEGGGLDSYRRHAARFVKEGETDV